MRTRLGGLRSVATIGRWSTRHPWCAIAAWLALVVVAVGAVIATGTETLKNGAVGESARSYDMLDENSLWPPPPEIAYLHSTTLHVTDPSFRAAITDIVERLGSHQVQITSPLQDRRLVSKDGRSALVVASLTGAFPQQVRDTILGSSRPSRRDDRGDRRHHG